MAHCYLALVVGDKEKKYVTLTGFPNTLWDAKVGLLARPEISDPVGVSYSPKGNDNSAGGEALGCHRGSNDSP